MNMELQPGQLTRGSFSTDQYATRSVSLAVLVLVGAFLVGCNESAGSGYQSAAASQTESSPDMDESEEPAEEPSLGDEPSPDAGAEASPAGSSRNLYFAWKAHPDATITGYQVEYGPTKDTATMVASDLPVSVIPASQLDAKVITVQYKSWENFRMHAGDQICFRVRAYNQDGISGYSSGACTKV